MISVSLSSARHQLMLKDHIYGIGLMHLVVCLFIPQHSLSRGLRPQKHKNMEECWVAGYIPRWFTHLQAVTHPSTKLQIQSNHTGSNPS